MRRSGWKRKRRDLHIVKLVEVEVVVEVLEEVEVEVKERDQYGEDILTVDCSVLSAEQTSKCL